MEQLTYQRIVLEVALPRTYQAANKNMDTDEVTWTEIEQNPLDHIEEVLQYSDNGLVLLSASATDLILRPGTSLEGTIEEFIDYANQAPAVIDANVIKGGNERLVRLQDLYDQAAATAQRVANHIDMNINQTKEEK